MAAAAVRSGRRRFQALAGLFAGWASDGLVTAVFVQQLRRKIEPEPSRSRYILTEPWVGYRFAEEAA